MSLSFGANATDSVNFGSAASLDNLPAWTICTWVFPTTLTAQRMIVNKGGSFNFRVADSGLEDEISLVRSRSTTTTNYVTNNANITTNKWWFMAGTFTTAGGAGEVVNIYLGDLSTVPTECTYGTATDGSGTVTDDSAANLWVGNNPGGTLAWQGRIAGVHFCDRVLTLGEIQRQWMRFDANANSRIISHLGFNGTGTQPDWSGSGNPGTVTGATVANHVPSGAPFGFNLGWQGLQVVTVPTLQQEGFRWRNDDGNETTATWAASQDANATVPVSTPVRLRVLVNGTGDPATSPYRLEYRVAGSSDAWEVVS